VHPEVVAAQVATMREWADQWEREALLDPALNAGYGEVAMLLRRTARNALRAVEPAATIPPSTVEAATPVPTTNAEAREDEREA
jgi:hypothetical protein